MSQEESVIPLGGWHIESEFTNCGDCPENHAGSIKLQGANGDFYVFKIEPNGSYALEGGYATRYEDTRKRSRELAELVVRVLNRELPGGKLRVRRKGAK